MIAKKLRNLFKPLQNKEAAVWQTNYLRNQFFCLGVRIPQVKAVVKGLESTDWRRDVQELWQEPEREFHHAAIFLAVRHRKKALENDLALYEKLIVEHSWWDTVDTVAPHLIGPLLLNYPELVPQTKKWLNSSYLWLRRTAIIHQLRAKGQTDEKRLFSYCSELAHEKEFFIQKAIGWALREYGKTNPKAVLQYVQTATLSPLSAREAKKRL